jgi:hypothetical protein
MPNAPYEHVDIRRNPDLKEWFCAKCGMTSDHALEQDAISEISGFECNLYGTTVKRLSEKERDLRSYHLMKLQTQQSQS